MPQTVNTPSATLNAFRDHGTVVLTLDTEVNEASTSIEQLADLGVDLNE